MLWHSFLIIRRIYSVKTIYHPISYGLQACFVRVAVVRIRRIEILLRLLLFIYLLNNNQQFCGLFNYYPLKESIIGSFFYFLFGSNPSMNLFLLFVSLNTIDLFVSTFCSALIHGWICFYILFHSMPSINLLLHFVITY